MSNDINDLAALVQGHVPEQPWGYNGTKPVPVEMWFDDGAWTVKFVIALSRGTQRKWHTVRGNDLAEVLKDARARQRMASGPSESVAMDSGFRRHQTMGEV
jgi:hypothetical protein